MIYVVQRSRFQGEWVVEAINNDRHGEGEIYAAAFSGPNSKERADEYADWKNGLTRLGMLT